MPHISRHRAVASQRELSLEFLTLALRECQALSNIWILQQLLRRLLVVPVRIKALLYVENAGRMPLRCLRAPKPPRKTQATALDSPKARLESIRAEMSTASPASYLGAIFEVSAVFACNVSLLRALKIRSLWHFYGILKAKRP